MQRSVRVSTPGPVDVKPTEPASGAAMVSAALLTRISPVSQPELLFVVIPCQRDDGAAFRMTLILPVRVERNEVGLRRKSLRSRRSAQGDRKFANQA